MSSPAHFFPSSTRKARAALFWGLAFFVVLQLALALVIDFWLPEWRDPFYAIKAARLQDRLRGLNGSDHSEPGRTAAKVVLMLGSSRTWDGLRGSLIEPWLEHELGAPVVVFNFGIPASRPQDELLFLKRLLDDGVRPDLLLLEVTPPLLDQHVGLGISEDRLVWRDLAVLEKDHLGQRQLRRSWLQSWPLPWYTHRFAILSAVLPKLLPGHLRMDQPWRCDASGSMPCAHSVTTPEDRQRFLAKARQQYEPILKNFRLGGPSSRSLRRILEECRREGIAAALVLMPEGSDFRGWYPPTARAQVRRFLADVSRRFDAPIIDANEWIADDGFMDSHHLSGDGISLFTQRLGQEALLPLLRKEIEW